MAMRPVGTPSRSASADVAARTVSMHTAGGSVRRLPAACPGNSTRSTATPTAAHRLVDGDEPGLLTPGTRPGREHESGDPRAAIGPSWRAAAARRCDGPAGGITRRRRPRRGRPCPCRVRQEGGAERVARQLGDLVAPEIERLGDGHEVVGDVPAEVRRVVRVDRHQEAAPHQGRQVVLLRGTGRRAA